MKLGLQIVLSLLVICGCEEDRRTATVNQQGLTLDGRSNILVVVGADASETSMLTAEYLVERLAAVAEVEVSPPSVGLPIDNGLETLVVVLGREALGRATVGNAGLYGDAYRVFSERRGRRTLIHVTGGSDLALRYGVNAFLSVLRLRYPHPETHVVSGKSELNIPLPLELTSTPDLPMRAVHLESVRPGPWVHMIYQLDADSERDVGVRTRLLDWLLWHRINTVAFDLLAPLTEAQQQSAKQFVEECQRRGLQVAAVVNGEAHGPFSRHQYGVPSVVLDAVDVRFYNGAVAGDAPDFGDSPLVDEGTAGRKTTRLDNVVRSRNMPVVFELPRSYATGQGGDVPLLFVGDVEKTMELVADAEDAGAVGALYRLDAPAYGAWLPFLGFATAAWDSQAIPADVFGRLPSQLLTFDWEGLAAAEKELGDSSRSLLLGDADAYWASDVFGIPTFSGFAPVGQWLGRDTSTPRAALERYAEALDAVVAGAERLNASAPEEEEQLEVWTLDTDKSAISLPNEFSAALTKVITLTASRARRLSGALSRLEGNDPTLLPESGEARTVILQSTAAPETSDWLLPESYYGSASSAVSPCVSKESVASEVLSLGYWQSRERALSAVFASSVTFSPSPIRILRVERPSKVQVNIDGQSFDISEIAAIIPPMLLGVHEWTQGFEGAVDLSIAIDVDANWAPDLSVVRASDGEHDPETQSSALYFEELVLPCGSAAGLDEIGRLVFSDASLLLVPRYEAGVVTDVIAMSLSGRWDLSELAVLIAGASNGAYSAESAEAMLRDRYGVTGETLDVRIDWVGFTPN